MRRFVAVVLAIFLLGGMPSFACGPFTLDAVFVHTAHPAYPLEQFAGGRMGVVQPTYARSYLYVAYRYFSGSGFTPAEQKAVTDLWLERLNYQWSTGEEDWIKAWLTARQKVAGAPELNSIDVYRNREEPNQYESYLNCQRDAFETAIATLNERINEYGAASPAISSWLDGQDKVFSNCAGGSSIPEPLPPGAGALMRADRSYQIAAANFYSEHFDEAREGFAAIAADANSPWQRNAAYLIARALIRKSSIGPPETRQESLRQAESQLKKILDDKSFSNLHAAATRLHNLVQFRLHPAERLRELAQLLAAPNQNDNLKQDLWDYTFLLDGLLEGEETKPHDALKADDLSDWIVTFQASDATARDHSLARWRATRSHAWLIALLSKVDGQNPQANELIQEALNVDLTSPAFASARFHAVRLLMESGKNAAARTLVDQLLNTEPAQFDESTTNLLTGKRMLLARNLPEFLADAARVPAALSWNDDGREIPAEDREISDEWKGLRGRPLFDLDAGSVINHQLPLALWKAAAKETALPAHLRRDLTQAAWLRAALLDDAKTANELAPILKSLAPELSPLLSSYLSTTHPDEKKFAAIYAWLKFPGLEPVVDVGIGRGTPLHERDTYRDNWWCGAAFTGETQPHDPGAPSFLSPAQLETGKKEWGSLRAFGAAPNYISRQVIQWANRNPNDPRVPEALHLAVTTTRYGCTDRDTGRWSKAAFDLLHRKYPKSSWARKTPYWFKD